MSTSRYPTPFWAKYALARLQSGHQVAENIVTALCGASWCRRRAGAEDLVQLSTSAGPS